MCACSWSGDASSRPPRRWYVRYGRSEAASRRPLGEARVASGRGGLERIRGGRGRARTHRSATQREEGGHVSAPRRGGRPGGEQRATRPPCPRPPPAPRGQAGPPPPPPPPPP